MLTIVHHARATLVDDLLQAVSALHPDVEIVDAASMIADDPGLDALLDRLPVPARELMNRSSSLYFALGLDDPKWSEVEVLGAGLDNPSLLRCPIAVTSTGAYCEDAAVELVRRVADRGDRTANVANGAGAAHNDNIPDGRCTGTA